MKSSVAEGSPSDLAKTPSQKSPFQSFFMGGFECATHRRRDRTRIDVLAMTAHDKHCAEDYRLLAQAGLRTVRDGLRWHLIETAPGLYDWTSFLPMLEAAHETGTQVLWDLCHWGVPEGLDPFSEEFPHRFAAFAGAAAAIVRQHHHKHGIEAPPFFCPINEISFWAWVGGDIEHFHPYGEGRGPDLKRQLARASIAAMHAVLAADPTARFMQAEPVIHISPSAEIPGDGPAIARHNASQFEAWDMLAGLQDSELGSSSTTLDLLGVNYYWNNQWIHESDRTPPGHELHKPFHQMLVELWERYQRPILVTETGAEADAALGWVGYIAAEVRQARRLGVPVLGICIYPVMDYPGWDDQRHCPCGLIEVSDNWSDVSKRTLRSDLAAEIEAQQRAFSL